MKTPLTLRRLLGGTAVLLLASAATGCGLEEQEIPSGPTGPSGLANAISVTAFPTQLPRDGSSASTVTVTATDVTGGPLAGQRVALSVTPSDARLSTTEVTTDSSGRATFTVTAPPATSSANEVAITATPIGGFSDTSARLVSIGLTGTPVGSVPAPTVEFTVSPEEPVRNQQATFTATATPAEGRRITQFAWNFGDGTTTTTTLPTVNKTFTSGGTFSVTVTVTDDLGQTGSATSQVTVESDAVAGPTVTAPTVTPSSPVVDQSAAFSTTATPGTGRTITRFSWKFGDDGTQTTSVPNTTFTFSKVGTHVVTVTATDDLGQTGSATTTVTVTGITPDFTMSPTNPAAGQTVRFDPRSSTVPPGLAVKEYRWDFGCTADENCTTATATTTPGDATSGVASTRFTVAKTFTIRLTVVDSKNRTYTTTKTLTVTATFAPVD